jgi:hypothetical protein
LRCGGASIRNKDYDSLASTVAKAMPHRRFYSPQQAAGPTRRHMSFEEPHLDEQPNESEPLKLKKLQLEIKNLRWGWLITPATAVLTVAIALYGWHVQYRIETDTAVRNSRLALEERFAKARETLSSGGAALRSTAALDLGAFAGASNATDGSGQANSTNAIAALENRLLVEDDPSVLRTLVAVLGNSGGAALTQTMETNRIASAEMATLYGEISAARKLATGSNVPTPYDSGRVSSWLPLDREVEAAIEPIESGQSQFLTDSKIQASDLVSYDTLFGPYREGVQLGASAVKPNTLGSLQHYARVSVASGSAIASILRSMSGRLKGTDMSGLTFYLVNISGVDLSGTKARNVFISGLANDARFADCDLTGSALQFAALHGADFTRAHLRGVSFPDLRKTGRGDVVVGSQATFADADWWNSTMWLPVGSKYTYLKPSWLRHFYPPPK